METIPFSWSDQRIDKFLATRMSYSRSFIQNLIDKEVITVMKWWFAAPQPIKKSYTLSSWDIIYVGQVDKFFDWSLLDDTPARDITVTDEYDDYAVIYKPAWVLSHPNSIRDINKKSVVGWVYHYFEKTNLPSSWSFIRWWLVHRLDKDTSGYMIIAKTPQWLEYFSQLFYQKSQAETITDKEGIALRKIYTAIVTPTQAWYEFLNEIEQDWLPYYIDQPVTPKTPHPITKQWISKILALHPVGKEDNPPYRLHVEILTWRTHQIRVHLSEHWLPIRWDSLYGSANWSSAWSGSWSAPWSTSKDWSTMELYASYLAFEDLYGDYKEYWERGN